MSLKESLMETVKLYEAIYQEINNHKADDFKRGLAEGMETVLEAVRVCLDENDN